MHLVLSIVMSATQQFEPRVTRTEDTKMFRNPRLLCGLMFLGAVAVLGACMPSEPPPPTQEQVVERGRYLVNLGGCNDCHTPKVFSGGGMSPDETRLLSGYQQDLELPAYTPDMVAPGQWILFNQHLTAAVGPWGVSFSANLTPDEDTGLGDWTDVGSPERLAALNADAPPLADAATRA